MIFETEEPENSIYISTMATVNQKPNDNSSDMCSDNQYGPDCKFPVVGSNDSNSNIDIQNIEKTSQEEQNFQQIQQELPQKSKQAKSLNLNEYKGNGQDNEKQSYIYENHSDHEGQQFNYNNNIQQIGNIENIQENLLQEEIVKHDENMYESEPLQFINKLFKTHIKGKSF